MIAIAFATLISAGAHDQDARVPEPEAESGRPTVGQLHSADLRATGQAPIAVPGAGNAYGARFGATGSVNPDRVCRVPLAITPTKNGDARAFLKSQQRRVRC
jgi:hypothetical protein